MVLQGPADAHRRGKGLPPSVEAHGDGGGLAGRHVRVSLGDAQTGAETQPRVVALPVGRPREEVRQGEVDEVLVVAEPLARCDEDVVTGNDDPAGLCQPKSVDRVWWQLAPHETFRGEDQDPPLRVGHQESPVRQLRGSP